MKRFRLWPFNGLAVLSLVLCIATVVLWVRSYFFYDHIAHAILFGKLDVIHSSRGMLIFERRLHWEMERYAYSAGWTWDARPLNTRYDFAWSDYTTRRVPRSLGFGFYKGTEYDWRGNPALPSPNLADPRYQRESFTTLILPDWAFMAMLSIAPIWLSFQIGRRLRATAYLGRNACVQCGYDLRATPDRCPECGTIPDKAENSK